jgi:hypothetical protein
MPGFGSASRLSWPLNPVLNRFLLIQQNGRASSRLPFVTMIFSEP